LDRLNNRRGEQGSEEVHQLGHFVSLSIKKEIEKTKSRTRRPGLARVQLRLTADGGFPTETEPANRFSRFDAVDRFHRRRRERPEAIDGRNGQTGQQNGTRKDLLHFVVFSPIVRPKEGTARVG
jgi:hypothetical protein